MRHGSMSWLRSHVHMGQSQDLRPETQTLDCSSRQVPPLSGSRAGPGNFSKPKWSKVKVQLPLLYIEQCLCIPRPPEIIYQIIPDNP